MLVSGDRESEVRYLAQAVGITKKCARARRPEEKVAIVNGGNPARENLVRGRWHQ